MSIPLTKPYWDRKEEKAVVAAMRKTIGTGDGPNTKLLVAKLTQLTGASYVFPVTSCTHGLELSLFPFDLAPDDEVIVPSFTMSSTANCVVTHGARPVFADIDPVGFMIDPVDVARRITKRTRGIMVVHYAGMPCPIEEILVIARKNNLFVIEDAAHAIGATYKGKALGTFGDIGVFSFHGTKNVTCGEGGAVVTNNKEYAQRMEIVRANGTNRNAFLRGDVDKYSWVDKGSSYFLSDLLASIVSVQLDKIAIINKKRNQIASYYQKQLAPFASVVQLPVVPAHTNPNWHIYALLFKTVAQSDQFFSGMRNAGIEVSRHYVPLHNSPMGKRLGFSEALPNTESVSVRLVRLPIFPDLTKKEIPYIAATARHILKKL